MPDETPTVVKDSGLPVIGTLEYLKITESYDNSTLETLYTHSVDGYWNYSFHDTTTGLIYRDNHRCVHEETAKRAAASLVRFCLKARDRDKAQTQARYGSTISLYNGVIKLIPQNDGNELQIRYIVSIGQLYIGTLMVPIKPANDADDEEIDHSEEACHYYGWDHRSMAIPATSYYESINDFIRRGLEIEDTANKGTL